MRTSFISEHAEYENWFLDGVIFNFHYTFLVDFTGLHFALEKVTRFLVSKQ